MLKTSKGLSPMTLPGNGVKGEEGTAMKEDNGRSHPSLTTSSEMILFSGYRVSIERPFSGHQHKQR